MPRARHPLIHALTNLRGNGRACVYTEPMWGLSMALVLPYASVYMLALGLDDKQIGLLASVSMLSQMVSGLVSGAITDKFGRRLTTAVSDFIAFVIPAMIWAFAQNFWWFLIAATINGVWQVSQNSWDCLLVEDVPRSTIPKVYSLVKIAADLSALFAPIAALLVSQFGLVFAVRLLYVNASFVMLAKLLLLYRFSTETRMGRIRKEQTKGVSLRSALAGYPQVVRLIVASKGTLFALLISAIYSAVWLVNSTFWQVVVNKRLGVPDALLPFFPMVRSLLSLLLFFTVIHWLTHGSRLRSSTIAGLVVYLAGQLLLVSIPAADEATGLTYLMLAVCLLLDAFGTGVLFMLSESLVALHVDATERSRVMAIQRTLVMLVSAPFGWISGWLSDMNRTWPFLLTSTLLVIGIIAAGRFWVTTHAPTEHEEELLPG
ncbi:MFS transporter [Aestuariimicrobium ganziense]|uniref:MFS transporter n=1 Tax=Aestuariimicrobium ganziense TaxID=2773677 RepID=UPI002E28D5AE|nr:MFS transporter [Aestuariimicrobium ganziense]